MSHHLPGMPPHDPAIWADFLALCGFGGRLTGTPGEIAARNWAAGRLAAIAPGCVSRQPTPYLGWRCTDGSLHLVDGEKLDSVPLLCWAVRPRLGWNLQWWIAVAARQRIFAPPGPTCRAGRCWCAMNTCSRRTRCIAG